MNTKTREIRLRRTAERRGYHVSKSRRRDPLALDYGRWTVTDQHGQVVSGPHGFTLDELDQYLTGGNNQ